jgi:hypothetical protein
MVRGTPIEENRELPATPKPARKEYIKSTNTSPTDSHLGTNGRRA